MQSRFLVARNGRCVQPRIAISIHRPSTRHPRPIRTRSVPWLAPIHRNRRRGNLAIRCSSPSDILQDIGKCTFIKASESLFVRFD